MRLIRSALCAVLCVLAWSPAASGATPRSDTPTTYPLRSAVRHLTVHVRTHAASYDRDADFSDWIAQGHGCDTRAVVLEQETLEPITESPSCTVLTGRWRSYYDATTYTH